jgi:hypothetical protein
VWAMDDLADEIVEMMIGDSEGAVEALFGAGRTTPLSRALTAKSYDALPEARPVEHWTQAGNMLAVDVDDPTTPAALGVLARELGVDAVLAIRHAWWLGRDRADLAIGLWAYDRCEVLLVDKDGAVLWRQAAVGRTPSGGLFAPGQGFGAAAGFQGVAVANEVRRASREAAREAWQQLAASFIAAAPAGSSAPKAQRPPPAPPTVRPAPRGDETPATPDGEAAPPPLLEDGREPQG